MATIDVAMESSVQAVKTVTDNIYAKVDTEIATINTNLNTVDGIVDTINSNVSANKTTLGTVNTNVNNINSTVNTINSNVSANKTTLGTVNTNVNNINSKMSLESTSQSILSKLNAGSAPAFRSPINITSPSAGYLSGSETFSGTGKGKLFIVGNSSSAEMGITVDGISNSVRFTEGAMEIEFTESFTVKAPNQTHSPYFVFCSAVFY